MSPFKVLGLTRKASLVEVKRAYAQLLRKHRPDEDPVGFQRVHEAFEACVARCRERDAAERERALAAETAPAVMGGPGDDGDGETDAQVEGVAAEAWNDPDSDEGGYAFRLPGDPAGPSRPPPLPSELARLHADLFDCAQARDPQALEAWLAQDERLYSLANKRALSDRLFDNVLDWPELDWRRLDVLFRFFEVDSLSDPRLRHDYHARELWLQVRGDERFERQLETLRKQASGKLVDRLAVEELFAPPSRWRRWKILALPSAAKEVRRRYEALEAANPERAHAAVTDRVHAFWLPLTDPARLDWRRLALVLAKLVVYSSPIVALLVAASGFTWPFFATMLGWTWGVGYALWLAWTVLVWARARYFLWRIARWGEEEAPPGSSLFADTTAVTCGVFVLGSILIWILARSFDKPFGGAIVQAFLLLGAGGVLVERKPGTRWDAVLFLVSWSLAIITAPFDLLWPGFDGDDRASVGLLAPALPMLALIAIDFLHARALGAYKSDVTARWSLPLVLLSVLALGVMAGWYARI